MGCCSALPPLTHLVSSLLIDGATGNELATAIASTQFTTWLRANAFFEGAAPLRSAYAVTGSLTLINFFHPYPTALPTRQPTGAPLSKGGIAGIVIACVVVALALLALLIWYLTRKTLVLEGMPHQYSEMDLLAAVCAIRIMNLTHHFLSPPPNRKQHHPPFVPFISIPVALYHPFVAGPRGGVLPARP